MSRRQRLVLLALLAGATLARVILAWRAGAGYDLESFKLVDGALRDSGLDVYSDVNEDGNRWPYPPGFFPAILGAGALDDAGLSFYTAIRLPAILADAALAWVVQDLLGRRGVAPRLRLVAAGAIALGPSFVLVSGYQGQVDSLAILPAVLALWVWTNPGAKRRALWAGALIGVGFLIKAPPIVMLLALLPSVRSRREAGVLVASAAALPLATLLPFLLADGEAVVDGLKYRGAAGLGGISLLVQPNLPESWIANSPIGPTGITTFLYDHGGVLTAVALLAAGAFLVARRADPFDATLLVWLVVYVFGVNFFMQYLVWGLPFLMLSGHVWAAIAVQAVLLPAGLLFFLSDRIDDPPSDDLVRWVYTPSLIAFWLACVAALVLLARRIAREGPEPQLR